jgi:hypothetical protein
MFKADKWVIFLACFIVLGFLFGPGEDNGQGFYSMFAFTHYIVLYPALAFTLHHKS